MRQQPPVLAAARVRTYELCLWLLLRSGRSHRERRRLHRLRFDALQHGFRAAAIALIYGQRNRGDHEKNRRPRRRFRKGAGCAARAERGLAALPAKRGGKISGAAALQQHDDDNEEASEDVYGGDEINHKFQYRAKITKHANSTASGLLKEHPRVECACRNSISKIPV